MQTRTRLMMGVALLVAVTAHAADVEVRCERRIAPARSRVAVGVRNIAPGTYRAAIISGTHSAGSGPENTIKDQVEFDFDSDPADIAAGANPIPSTFIRTAQLIAQIYDASGTVLVAQGVGTCRAR